MHRINIEWKIYISRIPVQKILSINTEDIGRRITDHETYVIIHPIHSFLIEPFQIHGVYICRNKYRIMS